MYFMGGRKKAKKKFGLSLNKILDFETKIKLFSAIYLIID